MLNLPFNLFSILPLFIFLYFIYKKLSNNQGLNKQLPPSPFKLPILGNLHQLGKHPHRSLKSLSTRYGELMLIHLGTKPTLIVSSSIIAKSIMKTHDSILSNRPKSSINDKLLYNSRVVGASYYGEYWRQMKSLFVLQLLSSRRVRSYRVIREEETGLLIESIRKCEEVCNLSDLFTTLTNDVVCRVAFGKKYSGGTDFREVLSELMELLGVFKVGDFIPRLSWVDRVSGLDSRMDKVAKKFDVVLEEILKEHLEKPNNSEERTKDFVDVLLDVQRDNSAGFPVEREGIKALILEAFAAGTHKTSTVLEWAMTELLRNPRVMAELQKEVRNKAIRKQFITEDDLENMSYLTAVIKETLRLHPPIPLLVPRESTSDLKLNGYDISDKTMIIINAWAIHRDPITWEEPNEFRPERFLNSSVDFKGQDFELIPFGAGRRLCPGIQFAMANNELVLANLVYNFDWSLPVGVTPDTLDMSEGSGLTVRRKESLLAEANPYVY
ncbi:cytochrome P450 736A117-like [Silene latifolia]|uniref:cytochrome P450 736A117-like n=1 Tax=Silene latifolia TaxID=37657 RepID=UPI003D78389D